MQEIDVFADSLRYTLQCCCQNTFFLKDKPPFNTKVPEGYASFDSVANPLEVKHLSISEVSKLSDILKEHQVESVMEQAQIRLRHQIEEHFKGILDKRGISEQDWQRYGYRKMNNRWCEYYYKDTPIFKISYPDLNIEPGSTKGTYSVFYEEL